MLTKEIRKVKYRSKRRGKAIRYQLGIYVIGLSLLLCYSWVKNNADLIVSNDRVVESDMNHSDGDIRKLEDTTISSYDATCGTDFPFDGLSLAQQRGGAIVIHLLILSYMFVALAVVCDEYFVSALEVICERLEISDDVAGATFMAAGGSAPELFTSLIGVFVTKSDVGFGTIVGSAVFNVLFVIGLCAVVSGNGLPLTWYPLARDSMYYTISLFLLALFVLDRWIQWYEALVMFCMYIGYVIIMTQNEKIKAWAVGLRQGKSKVAKHSFMRRSSMHKKNSIVPTVLLLPGNLSTNINNNNDNNNNTKVKDEIKTNEAEKKDTKEVPTPRSPEEIDESKDEAKTEIDGGKKNGLISGIDDVKEVDDDEYTLSMPDSITGKIFFVVTAPLTFTMFSTIPDCRKEEKRKYYKRTFVMSILYIGLSSYVMVWMASEIGCTLGLPESVMGITVLAAGTSIPDALSSMIVAREGHGDMAVSSSIGSNIFDICVGLPIPWLLNVLIQLAIGGDTRIRINSGTLWISVATLLIMLLATVFSIHISKWVLNRKLGIICGILYFVFIGETLLLDTLNT